MGSLLSLTQIPNRVLYFLSIPDKVETAEKLGKILKKKKNKEGFPDTSAVRNLPANAGHIQSLNPERSHMPGSN